MTLEELVLNVVKDYKENPFLFRKRVIEISPDEISDYEEMLMEKIPNLIITHQDTDTEEDIINQAMRINEMMDRGIAPYFIDISGISSTKNKKYIK